jgi:hypothetical protein
VNQRDLWKALLYIGIIGFTLAALYNLWRGHTDWSEFFIYVAGVLIFPVIGLWQTRKHPDRR